MDLESLKNKFLAEVNTDHIWYDWDGGWCYSYINHPLAQEDHNLSEKDELEWDQFTADWLYQNDGILYHMSDVVEDKLVNQDETLEDEEAKEYARGLIYYIEKYHGDSNFYKPKLAELKAFVAK